jgi:hypothetical protein
LPFHLTGSLPRSTPSRSARPSRSTRSRDLRSLSSSTTESWSTFSRSFLLLPFRAVRLSRPNVALLFSSFCAISSGQEEGATLTRGGKRHGTEGFFIEPTVFENVKPHQRIVKEEIFGPVVVVAKVSSPLSTFFLAALRKLTGFSLLVLSFPSSSRTTTTSLKWPTSRCTVWLPRVWTLSSPSFFLSFRSPSRPLLLRRNSVVFSQNISRALKVAHAIHAGTVWVNAYNQLNSQVPFGGYKSSGIGRELGEYALGSPLSFLSMLSLRTHG